MDEVEQREEVIRRLTAPAPVPLVPELCVWQAADAAALWETSIRDPIGWPDLPYWAVPWAGGQALARHLLDQAGIVAGRAVADFATGSGLVALAAARAGAARVLALDLDPWAEAAVALNAAENGVTLEFRLGDAIGDPLEGFDVVTVGDVFYERRLAERALPWLRGLAARGALVLAGDPGRTYSPETGAAGLEPVATFDVETSTAIEQWPVRRTRVLRIAP